MINYRFTQWNDGDVTNPRTITVTDDVAYTAYFEYAIGIDDHMTDNVKVYSYGRDIHVVNAEGLAVEIYDMTGKLVYADPSNSQVDKVVTMNVTGIYLVRVGDKHSYKVLISR